MNNQIHYLCNPFGFGGAGFDPGLIWYEAEDQNPGGVVTSGPSAKRAEFEARLTVSGVETFESYADLDQIDGVGILINTVTGTFSTPTYGQVMSDTSAGRFNTTASGSQWLDLGSDDPIAVITFDVPIAAMGCYITDAGDFTGQLSVILHKNGGGTVNHDIAHTVNGQNASLMFFGFVDGTDTYTSIEIRTTDTSEGIGVDDLTWATAAQLA